MAGNQRDNINKAHTTTTNKTPPPTAVSTIAGDLFPWVGRIHEGSVVYLVIDIFILIKRERPAKADVHDDADGPHVQ